MKRRLTSIKAYLTVDDPKVLAREVGKFFYLIGSIFLKLVWLVLYVAINLLLLPFKIPYYFVKNSFTHRPALSWVVLVLLIFVALFVWAFLAIPEFGVWLLFILAGIAFAHFFATADWFIIWWD
jgi:hypothetical protein